jgi:hypothetical protein
VAVAAKDQMLVGVEVLVVIQQTLQPLAVELYFQ